MHCFSPAKINLSLKILGKRADGFHELETLMAPLTLGDDLEIEATDEPGVALTCSDPRLTSGPDNLVWKALAAFAEASGTPLAYRVHLQKVIPMGAGLGGGSSNAATVLMAANELRHTPMSDARLLDLAAGIGSDVAFFCAKKWALCTGRGEIVRPVEPSGRFRVLLIKPPFGISTPWAYKNWATSQPLPGVSYETQRVGNLELVNDLERPVFQKYLILAHIKNWLNEQSAVEAAMMSGSGATIFALLKSDASHREAQDLQEETRKEFGPQMWIRLTETTA